MNKAKTLKRSLENPKPFLSVAWDTNDIPDPCSVNPNLKWKDINWKKVEKYVFKLQKLIYRASSRGEIRKMRKYQKLLTKSYYALLLAVRRVTQDNQGKKKAGIDGIKSLPPMQRFNLVDVLSSVAAYPGQKEYKNLENNRKELVKKIYSENLVFIDETEFSNYT